MTLFIAYQIARFDVPVRHRWTEFVQVDQDFEHLTGCKPGFGFSQDNPLVQEVLERYATNILLNQPEPEEAIVDTEIIAIARDIGMIQLLEHLGFSLKQPQVVPLHLIVEW